jgi:iron-sulfur cluster insertion protein
MSRLKKSLWRLRINMSMISITDTAKNQLNDLCESNKKWAVKLSVKGGGCAGFSYDWNFLDGEKDLEEYDEVIDIGSNKFVVDGVSVMYVLGTTLDYKKEIFGSSFVFENPNAKSSCGCGTSFAF